MESAAAVTKRPRCSPQATCNGSSPILSAMTCQLSSHCSSTSNSASMQSLSRHSEDDVHRHADPTEQELPQEDSGRLRQRRRIEDRNKEGRSRRKEKAPIVESIRLITPHNEGCSGISVGLDGMQLGGTSPEESIMVLDEPQLAEGEAVWADSPTAVIVGAGSSSTPVHHSAARNSDGEYCDAAEPSMDTMTSLHRTVLPTMCLQDAEYTAFYGHTHPSDAIAAGWSHWSTVAQELRTLQRSSVVGSLSKVMEYLHCSRGAFHSAVALLDSVIAVSASSPTPFMHASWFTSIAQCYPVKADTDRASGFVFRGLIAASVLIASKTRDVYSPSPQLLVQTIWGAERSLMSTADLQKALLRCELGVLTVVSFRVHRVTADEFVSSLIEYGVRSITDSVGHSTSLDYIEMIPRLLVDHIAVHWHSGKQWSAVLRSLSAVELGSAIVEFVLDSAQSVSPAVAKGLHNAVGEFLVPIHAPRDCNDALRQCIAELRAACPLEDINLATALTAASNLSTYLGASISVGSTKEEMDILEHKHQTERCRYAFKLMSALLMRN